jgi:hypothetical protein
VAEKAATELAAEILVRKKHEARVSEVQQELKDAVTKCEHLEQKSKGQASELTSLKSAIKEEGVKARGHEEELRQVKLIADGKPYLLQSVFGGNRFALLT